MATNWSRTLHFAITIGFLVFFAVHMLQVARAGWRNFTSMVTGYEVTDSAPVKAAAEAEVDGVPPSPTIDLATYRTVSRRSALTGAVSVVGAYAGWRWLQGRPDDSRIPDVLRRGHEANEALWRTLSRDNATAPTFPVSESSMLRVNGRHGIESPIDLNTWQLTVLGPDGSTLGTHSLDDIKALPFTELTVEHKCVEGWSHIVTWGGTQFSHLADLYAGELGPDLPEYAALVTPDREYYVGLDMPSLLNPQMLLAYELQGEPLDLEHGAPLRLATPNKYGIKCIKRIGTIQFTDTQPTDYWYERGYDWYAQL